MDVLYILKIACYSATFMVLVVTAVFGIKVIQTISTINKVLQRLEMMTDVKNTLAFFSWFRKKKT